MSIITIDEGTTLAEDQWIQRTKADAAEIRCLLVAKVLRPTESGDYVLSFVGVIIFRDSLLFARPKFGSASGLDLPGTLRILRHYFSRSSHRRPKTDRTRDPEFGDGDILREFDALNGLRDWFFTHGVYRREQAIVSNRGRAHWGKTIAKTDALIIQESVIYPSIIAERTEGIVNGISALQIGVLRHLLQRYAFPVPSSIRQAELATGSGVQMWPLDNATRLFYRRQLAAERRSLFRTDTLRLFTLLHEILDERFAAASSSPPQIYGTTAFYSVWEDACYTGIGCDMSWMDGTLGQPVWWTKTGKGEKHSHQQTQIPDLVVRRDSWLLIIDAKYYYPFPAARPGGPDIIKQLYYAESLMQAQSNLLSVFVLPLPGASTPKFLGYATIEGAHRTFSRVEAWGIDPGDMLSTYPEILPKRANALIDAIINHRVSVSEFADQTPVDISI